MVWGVTGVGFMEAGIGVFIPVRGTMAYTWDLASTLMGLATTFFPLALAISATTFSFLTSIFTLTFSPTGLGTSPIATFFPLLCATTSSPTMGLATTARFATDTAMVLGTTTDKEALPPVLSFGADLDFSV